MADRGGFPVVIVASGGHPVTNTLKAPPATPHASIGIPITLIASGGFPLTLINADGTAYSVGGGGASATYYYLGF